MITFLGVELSKEEEILLTGVIIELSDGRKLSDEDILHALFKKAESSSKLDIAKGKLRQLRKRYENKSEVDRLFLGKAQAYNKALDLLD